MLGIIIIPLLIFGVLGFFLAKNKTWRLLIISIFMIVLIGAIVSNIYYQNKESSLTLQAGKTTKGDVCISLLFPFIGTHYYTVNLTGDSIISECRAFYTGQPYVMFPGTPYFVGFLGDIAILVFFIQTVVFKFRNRKNLKTKMQLD